ncbi:hypothetical protein M2651_12285 [Clostridium sp. SYSU_GA19001]|uniref:hypothetical protein n=1 Tax=Clostridium caldaquaticum TaxID=2940653 RepID=UPI002076EA59|nr:hypothetical protein [Clostridium caldaquaticum]MCM8711792.1 hypothetical protein [Clostridium caldaquaticum]
MWGKRYKGLILIFTVFVLLLNFRNVYAEEKEQIKLKVQAGIEGVYKVGGTVPINIEIENNMKDINGEIQIEVNTSQSDNQNNVNLYAQSINLPYNSSKSVTMNIPITRYITKIKINLVEGKNTVYEKDVTIPGGLNANNILIGILSDDFDSVSYISDIKINQGINYSVRNVKLNEKNFSNDSDALNNFNVIVVNNFDTSKLSIEQYEALKKWVNNGGMLVVGTGPSYNKTLSIFKKDNFISGEIGSVSDISTKALYSIVEDNSTLAMSIPSVSIDIKGSTQALKERNFTLVHKLEKGRGVVAVAAFDFGINPVANWSQKKIFAAKLIGNLLPDYYNSVYFEKGAMMEKDLYIVSNTLRNIAELPIPKAKNLAIMFAVYILLVAPVNYFILKKLDKRELMWATVPALSIIFGIIMYYFGFSTRITEPIANVFSSVTLDKSGTMSSTMYAGIFTPSKIDIKVEGADGMKVKALPVFNYDYYRSYAGNEKAPKLIDAKITLGGKGSIEFYGNSIFSSKAVELNNEDVKIGKLDCSINYSNGAFKGELNNISGFDFEEAYIITNDNFISLGAIKNGEKITINDKGTYYNGTIYEFTNKAWKNPFTGSNPKTNLTDEELSQFRKDEQKRAAINLLYQGDYMKVTEPRFIGFSNAPLSKDILVNGKIVKKYERTLVSAPVNLTFRTGNIVEYPLGYIQPKVDVNNMKSGYGYNETGMVFYGNGTFEVSYDIDKNIDVEKIETTIKYEGKSKTNVVKQYIWNSSTSKYEELASTSNTFEKDEVSKYLDNNNTLKLKVEISEMDSYVEVPRISVKGSVK